MKTREIVLNVAMTAILGFSAVSAQAAMLNNGDQLAIAAGVATTSNSSVTSFTGSYFAMEGDNNSKIHNAEKVAIGHGNTGLVIGTTTAPGASHSGVPTVGDTNAITAPWSFFGNTGSDYLSVAVTGDTTAGLDMSGWTVTWNTIAAIPMDTGAWQTAAGEGHTGAQGTFTSGIGNFTWSGVYGTAYSLDYRATVPLNDPSGFGGVQYELHLEGIVNAAVPIPAAVWLFGSGLLGLMGMARRKVV